MLQYVPFTPESESGRWARGAENAIVRHFTLKAYSPFMRWVSAQTTCQSTS
jgi:hypothetical protein